MTLVKDTYHRKLTRPIIARPPTRARAPMPALVLVLGAGCASVLAECVVVECGVPVVDPGERVGVSVGVEPGVPVAAVVEGAALRLGVILNALRTCWFHPAERVCATIWTKRVSAENQLDKISLLKLTSVTVT